MREAAAAERPASAGGPGFIATAFGAPPPAGGPPAGGSPFAINLQPAVDLRELDDASLHAALAKTPRDVPALLGVLDGLTGGDLAADLPLSILSQVTEHVAALSKRKAPKLLQQKRAFVRGWHTDTRQLLGGNGAARRRPDGSSATGPRTPRRSSRSSTRG